MITEDSFFWIPEVMGNGLGSLIHLLFHLI